MTQKELKASLFIGSLCASKAAVASSIDIGGSSSGFLSKIAEFFQQVVDFAGGPGAMFIVFLSITVGLGMWAFMPKQSGSALGYIFRACIAGIGLFGMGTLLAWLQSMA
ncbi:hypothetical protein [Vibrio algicola]|uniref:hypothetical protein n=1 Tax=Vibrio algicola TaxID=2662262 RepID=UPI0015B50745|nr:hypothetical protein [Vibrio algicola]